MQKKPIEQQAHRCQEYIPHAVWPAQYRTCRTCGKASPRPVAQQQQEIK